MSMSLEEIGALVREYADARDRLSEVTDEVRDLRRRAVRERLRSIQSRAANVAAAKARLEDAIDDNRALFEKPKTQSLHGVQFGLRKMPGRLEGDPAEIVARIDRKLPERAAELVRVKRELNKAAAMRLPARELAAIGASLVQDDDQVVIRAPATDLDKFVEALLGEADDAGAGAS